MEKALEYIYSRRKFAKSNGLERIEALLNSIGNPQKRMRFVHVVGTNGKGSTSTMISYVLKEQGYKTGLFTSPFVIDFLERIQINNEFVDRSVFLESVRKVRAGNESIEKDGLTTTFFETVLAVALLCFEKSGCDIVILEAGIGGRDDSTNVIPAPDVFVLTSVSYDHTEVLGNSIRSIAESKCGAIKKGSRVVSFPSENLNFDFVPQFDETMNVLEERCSLLKNKYVVPSLKNVCSYIEDSSGIHYEYKGLNINIGFYGQHQLANSLVAVETLLCLDENGLKIKKTAIERGLSKAFIPCRMEYMNYQGKNVILDGGHNPGCMTALKKMLLSHFEDKKITAVMSFMKDKDIDKSIEIIGPICDNIIFTVTDTIRGASLLELEEIGNRYCNKVDAVSDKICAFQKALECENDLVVCAGSFFLVSDIRKQLKEE